MKPNESLFPAYCPNCNTTYDSSDSNDVILERHPLFKYLGSPERYVCKPCNTDSILSNYYPLKPK